MSQWGNLDNVTLKGTVTTTNSTDLILGYNVPEFTSNLNAGDYVTIDSNKYQVQNVVSNVQFYITNVCATSSANVKAFVQKGPKNLANVSFPANNYSIQNLYGADVIEIAVPENRNRGFSHTGWTHYTTYSDANGVRHKAETLVAMSKNFSANSTGTLFGVDAGQDAADDTILANAYIDITLQPSNVIDYLQNLSSTSFTVAANSVPTSANLVFTYQWQRAANTIDATAGYFANVNTGGIYSTATTGTLNLSNTSGLNGTFFRCVVGTADQGADQNTSATATITIL
jgi:hypothetical protein